MERYFYRVPDRNGEFRNIGVNWEEYQNQVKAFTFIEESRNLNSITLFDNIRNIRVLLPLGGGQASFRRENEVNWVPLFNVDRMERDFTQPQRNILKEDCKKARELLDRVISRLSENIIVPTPKLHDMRLKVNNIFHINLVNPDPGDVPVEAFFFATLISNFKTLRSVGFDHDPPFLFEPDHTGIFNAWVNGVDDPTVHISPNHFYMDRDNLVITLIHERTHTVLRLQGHPGGIHVIANPADGVPTMTRDDALKNAYCYEWLTAALRN